MMQTELGETLGISSVHVNRTVQELRAGRLVTLERGVLTGEPGRRSGSTCCLNL